MNRSPPSLKLVYSCGAFPLAGSSKQDRLDALSFAVRQFPPENTDPDVVRLRRALFDVSQIVAEYDSRSA